MKKSISYIKRVLLLLCVLFFSYSAFAQSAYKSINIESKESYEYRKSNRGRQQSTYSSYTGNKSHVDCSFINSKKDLAYSLYSSGVIYDHQKELRGRYFVGEEMYYQCYKVYIRWDHGGETTGSLSYGERSDGKPKFRITIGSSRSLYQPY